MHWWLVQVAGTSGKVQQTADEDVEGISSDAHGAAISEALGMERRNEVSASHTAQSLPPLAVGSLLHPHQCLLYSEACLLPVLWETL